MFGTVKSVVALHDILREFETVPSDHVETTMIEFEFDTSNQFCLDGDVVVAPRVIAADQVMGCAHITSDAATAIIYITVHGDNPTTNSISAYQWHAKHETLVFVAHVTTFAERLSFRKTTVVHASTMTIRGLAADPSGTAIAVYDGASSVVRVLSWPLPGMLMPVFATCKTH